MNYGAYHRGNSNSSNSSNNNNMAHYRSNSGGGSGSSSSGISRADEASRSLMEQENDMRWMELGQKVDMLKSLSMDIHSEVKSQNSLLDSMGDSFGSVSSLFTSTLGKLGQMMASGSSHHMYYLVAFVVFTFLVIYFMMGK